MGDEGGKDTKRDECLRERGEGETKRRKRNE